MKLLPGGLFYSFRTGRFVCVFFNQCDCGRQCNQHSANYVYPSSYNLQQWNLNVTSKSFQGYYMHLWDIYFLLDAFGLSMNNQLICSAKKCYGNLFLQKLAKASISYNEFALSYHFDNIFGQFAEFTFLYFSWLKSACMFCFFHSELQVFSATMDHFTLSVQKQVFQKLA